MKQSLNGLNSRLKTVEDKISEPVNIVTETSQLK